MADNTADNIKCNYIKHSESVLGISSWNQFFLEISSWNLLLESVLGISLLKPLALGISSWNQSLESVSHMLITKMKPEEANMDSKNIPRTDSECFM